MSAFYYYLSCYAYYERIFRLTGKSTISLYNLEVKVKNFLSRETRLKTKTMNTDSIMPSANDMCSFFARYSAWLIGCGATCIRLEKNVCRMAAAYGKEVELSIMPRHVHIALKDNDKAEVVTVIASVEQRAVSFNINTRLSKRND